MTTANKITLVRILLVPFFVVQMLSYRESGDEINRLLAVLSFGVAALTDALDGYVARRYNQHSELGAIMDPLADKLLLVSAIILLSLNNSHFFCFPLWLTATIISRDLLLLLGLGVIQFTVGKATVRPRWSGKLATVFQMAAILWNLFHWDNDFLPWLMFPAAFFTALSGALYIWDGFRQLGASPASSPIKPHQP